MATDPAIDDVETERLIALGMVLDRAALLEYDLGRAFTMLLESKYGDILAAGQGAEWLMQNCELLVRARQEIPEDFRAQVLEALAECRAVCQRRNTLVHAIKTSSADDGELRTVLTRRGGRRHIETWTPALILEFADELLDASSYLVFTVEQAVEVSALIHRESTLQQPQGEP